MSFSVSGPLSYMSLVDLQATKSQITNYTSTYVLENKRLKCVICVQNGLNYRNYSESLNMSFWAHRRPE